MRASNQPNPAGHTEAKLQPHPAHQPHHHIQLTGDRFCQSHCIHLGLLAVPIFFTSGASPVQD